MGLFDFLKKAIDDTSQQAVLDNPHAPIEKKQAAYLAIREKEVMRLNATYDFNSIQGVRNIPVPCRKVNGDSPTGRVEYYLRGQCFAKHRDAGNIELAVECILKAHDLMFISDMIWDYDAFISDISWLHSVGKHNLAWKEEERVDAHFKKAGFYPKLTRKDFSSAKSFLAWKENVGQSESERLRKRAIRHEYYWLQEHLPELCPKSLSGYSRMKNTNSKNYQKLVVAAKKLGKQL